MSNDHADPTLDPFVRSWVESANDPACDFSIQNLPFCCFENPDEGYSCIGVRIGDKVLDVRFLHRAGVIHAHDPHDTGHPHNGSEADFCQALEAGSLSELFSLGRPAIRRLRELVFEFLREGAGHVGGQKARRVREACLFDIEDITLQMPIDVPNYTDFYASVHHATTVGSMFRPDTPLLPNYKYVPIGYHGRASSVVLSGTDVIRPHGQTKKDDAPGEPVTPPVFAPTTMLDYELEVGAIIGRGNALGSRIPIEHAEEHVAGLVLVNDWSARDVQKWEYQPLGPFLAKNFATTISPYVVSLDALAPFRCPAFTRPSGDPAPLPYLHHEHNRLQGGIDITLEVCLLSAKMAQRGMKPQTLSRSSAFKDMYWTLAQLVTHHASNGCNLTTGDLLASGTISGPEPGTRGCLLELTWAGRDASGRPLPRTPIELPTGEKRLFLEDGDEVIIKGWCERAGYRRIGLGECRGRVIASQD